IILLSQNAQEISSLPEKKNSTGIDHIYRWSGHSDLLLAIIKIVEDHAPVSHDTAKASVRVLILGEDSPDAYSHLLPILYKEIVNQIQALLEVGLTEKQRAMTLRARPKILLAKNYEEGLDLYRRYQSCLLCLISDTRLPMQGKISADAGIRLLSAVRKEMPDMPTLLMSTDAGNKGKAKEMGLEFINKNSPNLAKQVHIYFRNQLGFGDFIFRIENGMAIDHASDFLTLEAKLHEIPNKSLAYHALRNHFSRWVMARLEISLALKFRSVSFSDFDHIDDLRDFLINNIHALRYYRQRGVVSIYDRHRYDWEIREFVKIGNGSLGGKARGLAFMYDLLRQNDDLQKKHPLINIRIPKTLVISTTNFDTFVSQNKLQYLLRRDMKDPEVAERFLKGKISEALRKDLNTYLKQVKYPLSIRSSSQMEDSHYQPYAGLYGTYKIPNNHPALSTRLSQLIKALKLVYASTYFEGPKSFSRNTSNQHSKESMAVIIQEVVGQQYGDYFYPAISGLAQSHNYYPFDRMKAEEGLVHMALGLGKTVVDGERCLRFSPRYPDNIPELSVIQDMLKNTQRHFYALKTSNYPDELQFERHANLEKREISDALDEDPVKMLCSTYIPDENRIRHTWDAEGPKVLTFARILKYGHGNIPALFSDLLELGQKGFGCPVEIEFAINLHSNSQSKADFYLLQIRPMFNAVDQHLVRISSSDEKNAFCRSSQALGNGINHQMMDIIYIKPDDFRTEVTRQIAEEINRINTRLQRENRTYLLVGPGRWGGSDRWLGIPVKWRHISNVGAIIELRNEKLSANPSQGSHFFHNITSLGIHYIMINEICDRDSTDYFDWNWVNSQPAVSESAFVRHVRLTRPFMLKIDGKRSRCVIMKP
ncbi:MAG: PEP/pyruvate-binding domain-containing protein, partial [bacterium]